MVNKKYVFIGFILVTALLINLILNAEPENKLEIMVVAADKEEHYAGEIKTLLEANNCTVTITNWASVSADSVKSFGLVILTGKERKTGAEKVISDFPVPVLGYGVYGCGYFGILKLKNGHPYT